LPETIGSIIYLSRHLAHLKAKLDAGFVVTCVGDERAYSFLPSRLGDSLADRIAVKALQNMGVEFKRYTFLDRGSDERQYCSPRADLPVALIMRSKFGEFPEYHSSADDLSLVTAKGLSGALAVYRQAVDLLENEDRYQVTVACEPQLGKRGLYPTTSTRDSGKRVRDLMNVIAYCDGQHSLGDLSRRVNLPESRVSALLAPLISEGLVDARPGPRD